MALEGSNTALTETARILIVDDESFVRNALQIYLETHGYRAETAAGGEEALRILADRTQAVDVVLLDLVMPGMYGIEVLRRMKEMDETVEVIIATGCGSVHSAIEAMRFGAFDYITKPIVNFDEDLLKVVQAALLARRKKLSEGKGDPDAEDARAGDNPLAPPSYYPALEELAGAILLERPPEVLDSLFEDFIARHLNAECLILFREEAAGNHVLLRRWGTIPRNIDFAIEELYSLGLWRELDPELPSWKALRIGEKAHAGGEAVGTSACLEAMRIHLHPGRMASETAASDALLLRRVSAGQPDALPRVALLSLVLALSQKSSLQPV